MRYRLIIILIILAVPIALFAAQKEAVKKTPIKNATTVAQKSQLDRPKAKTLDELAAMYDVSKCKECHVKEYEEWAKSLHSMSLVGTGRTMATIRTAITDGLMKEQPYSGVKKVEDVKKVHLMQCLKCHLPQLEDATDNVALEIAQAVVDGDQDKLKKVSINCLVCHNKKAIIHKWHDGEPQVNVVYGKKDGPHPHPAFTSHKRSPIMQEAVMCGQCHGTGPNFDQPNPSQCATLYGSYLHSYIPSGGTKTCQECHMQDFHKGHHMSSYRDPEVGKRAVEVVVEAPSYQFLPRAGDPNPMTVLTVKLTNRAGHRIPDG